MVSDFWTFSPNGHCFFSNLLELSVGLNHTLLEIYSLNYPLITYCVLATLLSGENAEMKHA